MTSCLDLVSRLRDKRPVTHRANAVAALLCLSLAGAARAGDPPPQQRDLVVLAAASLRDAFTAIAGSFETSHPGVHVTLSFSGSQDLRAQVEHGGTADVFASADAAPLIALEAAGLSKPSTVFARNVLVIVVPQGNPSGVATFDDLPKAKKLVIGVSESPIGGYTLKILQRADKAHPGFLAQVEKHVASRELNVRQVLAKVSLGEADAGIVYRTDALSAKGKATTVEIPAALNEIAEYPIATLTHGKQPALAQEFIAMVTGAEGQRLLAGQGFQTR
jgi:molybdate transport system substrate-binding protein